MPENQNTNSAPAPLNKKTSGLGQFIAEIKANPRLQMGLGLILAVALISGLLSLDDQRKAAEATLTSLQSNNAKMNSQLGSANRQTQIQTQLEQLQQRIDTVFWKFPSPGIAQTDFGDWLKNGLKESGIPNASIVQPSFRFLGEQKGAAASGAATARESCKLADCELIEIRSSLRFRFEPASFVKVLALFEGADKGVRIEQLTLNAQQVEMTVVALAALTSVETDESAEQHQAKTASAVASAAAASAPDAIKKVVEIKW